MKIAFVLPVSGGGGGAHSVVQEVSELQKMGISAFIAVNQGNKASFATNYADLPELVGSLRSFSNTEELAAILDQVDIAVATIFTSVSLIKEAREKSANNFKVAYYIQDYEPLFCAPNTPLWLQARESYELIPDAVLFTKTKWQQEIVARNHGKHVHKVSPSLDHEVYFPTFRTPGSNITVSAMVRPKSPRRAPRRTMRILRALKMHFGSKANIEIFGCSDAEITDNALTSDFPYVNHGVLTRHQVSALLRQSDLFLDLSDYQAFGRTGLEAMACGCIPVVPVLGGTCEYARHKENSFVVDTRSDKVVLSAIVDFFNMEQSDRQKMIDNAIQTSMRFSVRKAAISEYLFFRSIL